MKKLIILVKDGEASWCTVCNQPNQDGDEFIMCGRPRCRNYFHPHCQEQHERNHEDHKHDERSLD